MREFDREEYDIRHHDNERFSLHFFEDQGNNFISHGVERFNTYEEAYLKAKMITEKKQWKCEIWELSDEFIPRYPKSKNNEIYK